MNTPANLRISLLQLDLQWEDAAANRNAIEQELKEIEGNDLILLPEMFTTAFSMNSESLAEAMDGETLGWMKQMASEKEAVICGSIIIKEDQNYFNRLIWMRPDGSYETYDKRHLFRMAHEEKHFSCGNEKLIVELKGWKICPLICYDLRFPVWSRKTANQDYDLLIYLANWPAARASAWEKLLYARAIENQAYVIGLNRVGEDANGNLYSGKSMAIDAKGEDLWKAGSNVIHKDLTLHYEQLASFRVRFPVHLDADSFVL